MRKAQDNFDVTVSQIKLTGNENTSTDYIGDRKT